ncbi:hypothetical protein E2C01_049218 [Portunus trituberculatus]|uniref:Uncharacterized protein n=1 Tax=Portunus trituberculatus TaxID=210409 RepID=A0A5B7GCJ6_PORTR|nr:hypothetical protein [Portunus trituberculatus]
MEEWRRQGKARRGEECEGAEVVQERGAITNLVFTWYRSEKGYGAESGVSGSQERTRRDRVVFSTYTLVTLELQKLMWGIKYGKDSGY